MNGDTMAFSISLGSMCPLGGHVRVAVLWKVQALTYIAHTGSDIAIILILPALSEYRQTIGYRFSSSS